MSLWRTMPSGHSTIPTLEVGCPMTFKLLVIFCNADGAEGRIALAPNEALTVTAVDCLPESRFSVPHLDVVQRYNFLCSHHDLIILLYHGFDH